MTELLKCCLQTVQIVHFERVTVRGRSTSISQLEVPALV